jgi:hypothetical protein
VDHKPSNDDWSNWHSPIFNGEVSVRDERLQFLTPWYIDAFDDFEVTRIRRCPHCRDAFLQLRKNQEYCSKNCRDNARGKKYREKHKLEISERRSRNYLRNLGRTGPKKIRRT